MRAHDGFGPLPRHLTAVDACAEPSGTPKPPECHLKPRRNAAPGFRYRARPGPGGAALLQAGRKGVGNKELAQRTALPRFTIARLAHTLTELGDLEFHPDIEKYGLGLAVLNRLPRRARRAREHQAADADPGQRGRRHCDPCGAAARPTASGCWPRSGPSWPQCATAWRPCRRADSEPAWNLRTPDGL